MRSGVGRRFLRFTIGAILLVSAAGKLLDIAGFTDVLKTYEAFPDAILLPLALTIPLAELALALWLLSGRSARVLESGEGSARVHFVWAYPFPFRNRDAVVLYRSEKTEAGAFVLSWKTDARPRPEDPKEGVRIERVDGETRVEPIGPSRCRVIYTYLGDLGGKFPAWAQEKAWKEEPVQYIRALRRRLNLLDPAE